MPEAFPANKRSDDFDLARYPKMDRLTCYSDAIKVSLCPAEFMKPSLLGLAAQILLVP
jgi:hypothetical protein